MLICGGVWSKCHYSSSRSLDELRKPGEAILVAYSLDHTAHEQFYRPCSGDFLCRVLAEGLVEWQAQQLPQLLFLVRLFLVYLIPEYDEGHIGEFWHLEQLLELPLGLFQAGGLCRIYHKDNAVEGAAVLGPRFASLLMATQIVGVEANVSNGHLGLMRVHCGVGLRKPVALEHV